MNWTYWSIYEWVCWMFGFWYFHRRWSPGWDTDDFPVSPCAAISSLVVSWFSWPLMVVYLLAEYVDYVKKSKVDVREEVLKRSKEWDK